MSRSANLPSQSGRKIFGAIILVVIMIVIAIGIIQKSSSVSGSGDAHPVSPSAATPLQTSNLASGPVAAPPAPAAVAATCHKAINASPPVSTEGAFIDIVWQYESAYLSANTTQQEAIYQRVATKKYLEDNRLSNETKLDTITTAVIPSGSVITWKDDSAHTQREVSTIVCIQVTDSGKATSLPHTVQPHFTTWVKTADGWRVDHETNEEW